MSRPQQVVDPISSCSLLPHNDADPDAGPALLLRHAVFSKASGPKNTRDGTHATPTLLLLFGSRLFANPRSRREKIGQPWPMQPVTRTRAGLQLGLVRTATVPKPSAFGLPSRVPVVVSGAPCIIPSLSIYVLLGAISDSDSDGVDARD
jgi:hypothetical protein